MAIVNSRAELLQHAGEAVGRAAQLLAELRDATKVHAAGMGRQHRLYVQETIMELDRRRACLASVFDDMRQAPADDLPRQWQRFFACYDDYLAAVRKARHELARGD